VFDGKTDGLLDGPVLVENNPIKVVDAGVATGTDVGQFCPYSSST